MSEAAQAHRNGGPPPNRQPSFRFLSDVLPQTDRLQIWREVFGEKMLRMRFDPLAAEQFRADWTVMALAGPRIAWATNSPLRVSLQPHLITDAGDSVAFQWATSPRFGEHLGQEISVEQSDAVILSGSDPGHLAFPSAGQLICMTFPRDALGPLLRDKDVCLGRALPGRSSAVRMLLQYLEIVRKESDLTAPEVQRLAVTHIYDLLAVAMGATRDAEELARGRGIRAAHLHAIKKDVVSHIEDDLSIDGVAARHGLSPRYIRMLFESEGTTFTEFVREERLNRAHRMLISRRFDHRRIADIAYETGFNDLSYFNRTFRRRFGMSPGDVRHGTRNS